MHWFLYLFGLLTIAYGCCAVLYSFEVRQGAKYLVDTADKRIIAALPAVLGVLLIISSIWSALFGMTVPDIPAQHTFWSFENSRFVLIPEFN